MHMSGIKCTESSSEFCINFLSECIDILKIKVIKISSNNKFGNCLNADSLCDYDY